MNLQIKTKNAKQVIDITKFVQKQVSKSSMVNGICLIFVKHTTCAITTMDSDPGTDLDFIELLEEITPDLDWRHLHNPEHVPDHIYSSIIGPSLSIPFADKKLSLGSWQRIVLVELNGPKERDIDVSFVETTQ